MAFLVSHRFFGSKSIIRTNGMQIQNKINALVVWEAFNKIYFCLRVDLKAKHFLAFFSTKVLTNAYRWALYVINLLLS